MSVSLRRSDELHRPGTTVLLSAFSRYAGCRNTVRIFLQDSGKHPDIQIDSLADFAQTDEFVRTVRPCAVAYAQLQRRDVEQGLVRCRGRSVGRAAQRQSGPDDRVSRRDARRLEPGRAGRDLASDVAADFVQHLLVRVAVRHSDVDREPALGRHDIVLRSGRNDRDGHLDRPEQFRHLRETVTPEPLDVLHGLVDRVVAFLARRVARTSARRAVDDHQSPFGDGQLHLRGLADDGEVERTQLGQHAFQPVAAAVLFLGRDRHAQVVFHLFPVVEVPEGRQQRYDARSGVVAAKPVEPVALDGRIVRVARVTAVGPHRVVVRVEQDRRLRGVVMPVECPDVVFLPMRLDAAVGEKSRQPLGRARFLAARRRNADQVAQQRDRIAVKSFRVHVCMSFHDRVFLRSASGAKAGVLLCFLLRFRGARARCRLELFSLRVCHVIDRQVSAFRLVFVLFLFLFLFLF